MHSSLFHSMTRAGLALLVSSFLLPAWADAASIREVSVSVTGAGGMPPAVEKRITASISAIGNRILVGKDESLFRSHESEYDKVLADIVNRVVMGYVVDDISASYGEKTALHVSLTPVGQMIREVETEIDYGESVSGSGSAGEEGQRRCTAPYESAPLGASRRFGRLGGECL